MMMVDEASLRKRISSVTDIFSRWLVYWARWHIKQPPEYTFFIIVFTFPFVAKQEPINLVVLAGTKVLLLFFIM